jgi:MYXO-CTERM domain-containing protein
MTPICHAQHSATLPAGALCPLSSSAGGAPQGSPAGTPWLLLMLLLLLRRQATSTASEALWHVAARQPPLKLLPLLPLCYQAWPLGGSGM